MGKAIATGELIRISEIAADAGLCERLLALAIGDGITLEVGGVRGRWERVRDASGSDALRPIGDMRAAWARMCVGGQPMVAIIEPQAEDPSLATFGLRLHLWDTPENQIH